MTKYTLVVFSNKLINYSKKEISMDKKEIIIEAAKKAFRQYGIYKTTLDDVGNHCGMRKNSLYYYFKNKEDLFRATIRSEFESFIRNEKEFIKKDLPLKELLRAYIEFRYQESIKFVTAYELMKYETQQVYHQIFHDETEYLIQEESQVVYEMIHRHVAEDTDFNSLITIIISINQGLLYKSFFLRNDNTDIIKEIDTIIHFLFNGIKTKE